MVSFTPNKCEATDNQIFQQPQKKKKTQPHVHLACQNRCFLSLHHPLPLLSRETPSPVHPLNAGAPSSKLSAEDQAADPTPTGCDKEEEEEEEEEGGTDLQAADSQPQEMLTH